MVTRKAEIYILYQMGASEDWTWFSPIGVFLTEKTLWEYIEKKGILLNHQIRRPTSRNEVHLSEPQDYVIARSREGEVPDVELETADR